MILQQFGADESVLNAVAERKNPTTQLPLAAAYDWKSAERVYALYQSDFEAFGYEKNSWLFI